jgi:small-conductance mechanosensitive channel
MMVNGRHLRLFIFAVILAAALPRPALAADAAPDPVAAAASWERQLADVERIIDRSASTIDEHPQIRQILLQIQRDAGAAAKQFAADAEAVQKLLTALGPAPNEGEPPEAADTATTRAELVQKLAAARSGLAKAELALSQAQDLLKEARDDFRKQFLDTLTSRAPLPDSADELGEGALGVWRSVLSIAEAPAAWWRGLAAAEKVRVLASWQPIAALALLGLALLPARPALRRWRRDPTLSDPPYGRRLLAAFTTLSITGIVPALVLGGVALWVGRESSPVPDYPAHVVATACEALIAVVLAVAYARVWLRPSDPAWRIAPLKTGSARRLFWRILLVAVIFAAHRFVRDGAAADALAALPLASRVLYGLSYTALAGLAILLLCRDNGWKCRQPTDATAGAAAPESADEEETAANGRALWGGDAFRFARRLVSLVVVIAIIAAFSGYIRLAYYLIDNVLFTGVVVAVLAVLRRAGREALRSGFAVSRWGRKLDAGAPEHQARLFWAGLLVNLMLLAVGIFIVAPNWGVPRALLWSLVASAIEGFQIGSFTLSLIDVALALLVVLIGLAITRAGKQALSTKVLTHTKLDVGARQSIVTAAGYAGLVLTGLLAISVMGLSLSNLAIIAGALSVGIGFGLQQIVNNFVSGLILLVERPVNIGDWIVVGDQEGHVRRISVRATEIETFQRAAVIVPNAQLISERVINWTHANKTGRLDINVGVAYGSDPERVMAILAACAKAHPQVLAHPPPFALFMDFGASSLDFQLRCYIIDINNRLSVASALRVAIHKALKEAGIEIPFPQQDIHLRDLDRLEAALKPAAEGPRPAAEPEPDIPSAPASPVAQRQR